MCSLLWLDKCNVKNKLMLVEGFFRYGYDVKNDFYS